MKNNTEWQSRTIALFGETECQKLAKSRVAVFGIGGVGGHVCEGLARAGVGFIDLFDGDRVSLSNLNRQIVALHSTIGRAKVAVMKERILDINPLCVVSANEVFYGEQNAELYPLYCYDYVIDAIDNIEDKLTIITHATQLNVKIISCMGTGNRKTSEDFTICDINKTNYCPLAKKMRLKLRQMEIKKLKVLCANTETEKVINTNKENHFVGSVSFVPSVAGLMLAGEVIRELCKK